MTELLEIRERSASSFSLVVLVLSKSPHGMEEFFKAKC
jgi:hypothetical protein